MYNRMKCRDNFVLNCEKIRNLEGLTQKQMADILGITLATYRKMVNYEIDKIGMCTALNLSEHTGISVTALASNLAEVIRVKKLYDELSPAQKNLTDAIIEFQHSCRVDHDNNTIEIPMIMANSEFYDGFNLDTLEYHKYALPLDVYNKYKNEIICAMKLPNSYYTPTFLKGDVIIVGRGRQPRENEIGIFTHKREVHFRKLQVRDKAILTSIRAGIPPMEVDLKTFSSEWLCFGYVLERLI